MVPLTGVPLTASTTRSASLSGNAEEGEVLEHAHVAHRLAVDAGRAGHGMDEVGHLDALRAADARDQLGLRLVAVAGDVRLGMPARALGHRARASSSRPRPTA